jgi:uncharacterized membrane protein
VSPGQLKVGAIGLTLLSLTLLVVAVRGWTSTRGQPAITSASRAQTNWLGGLLLFAVALVTVSALVSSAAVFGWPRDRTLWIGVGTLLALMTLSRPRWFWENWKARMLRNLIGDAATAAVYLAIAGAMVWIGRATDWTFGRQ